MPKPKGGPKKVLGLDNIQTRCVLTTPSEPESDALRCEVERVTYRNDENGWTVLKIRDQHRRDDLVTATGHFAQIRAGEQFQFFGAWTKHQQYGWQFKVQRAVPVRPNTEEAILRYLSSGLIKGIGEKTAEKIVAHFGMTTLDVLDEEPNRVRQVPSIGPQKAAAIAEAWQAQKSVAEVMMFLNQHGISPTFASRIYKTYGDDAISVVSDDPYRLATDIQGIGFLKADTIAQELGIERDSPQRIRAAILYYLQQAEDRGHCFLTEGQLHEALGQLLQLSTGDLVPRLGDCLDQLRERALITKQRRDSEAGWEIIYYKMDLFIAEENLAEGLSRLASEPMPSDRARIERWLSRYEEAQEQRLTAEQRQAVAEAGSGKVFILTGGPGVGKTTTANAVIRLFKAMGRTVALCAPTGRAAQRLTEISATPAKTIHRLLEWNPGAHGFGRDETNPLSVQVVVVDEASMLDLRLAEALVRAIPDRSQVIFIGDCDQLPAVGPGNVLKDMLNCAQFPKICLTEIFRQAAQSQIVRSAHAINKGTVPEDLNDQWRSDCQFVEADRPEEISQRIHELVRQEIPSRLGVDPIRDIQVLTPMNRGDLGTSQLNQDLQRLLNPERPGLHRLQKGSLSIQAGDKVIQSANNYDLGVFNGDIGIVQNTGIEGGKVIVRFETKQVIYGGDDLGDLKLAYAITIHKSQGSEFPVVVIPISTQHYIMLQRNLIYTALTRARKLAIFVGSRKALRLAVDNEHSAQRQTRLGDRLREFINH